MSGLRFISYGGGVQSTALLVLAAQRRIDYRIAVMANVGDDSEHPATLAYVRDVAAPYLRLVRYRPADHRLRAVRNAPAARRAAPHPGGEGTPMTGTPRLDPATLAALIDRLRRADEVTAGEVALVLNLLEAAEFDLAEARDTITRTERLAGDLHRIATDQLRHRYRGLCPDPIEGPATRDPLCAACKVLIRYDRLAGGETDG